jgi:hypothetical protein
MKAFENINKLNKLSAAFVATKQVLDVLHPNRNKRGGMAG